ncbi:hypothetical protein B0H15DRAFT_826140 [Mycena belliarum]|uniref:Uncharacterized protein n=1 Tax=Mycena belliarum TaxID=1033014 RepID=A0AAD6UA70_9AGAR|nr:hypothetical protein B0H15DRAFT_826140 [Mycena belliae]
MLWRLLALKHPHLGDSSRHTVHTPLPATSRTDPGSSCRAGRARTRCCHLRATLRTNASVTSTTLPRITPVSRAPSPACAPLPLPVAPALKSHVVLHLRPPFAMRSRHNSPLPSHPRPAPLPPLHTSRGLRHQVRHLRLPNLRRRYTRTMSLEPLRSVRRRTRYDLRPRVCARCLRRGPLSSSRRSVPVQVLARAVISP